MRLNSVSKFNTINNPVFYKKNQFIKQKNDLYFKKELNDDFSPKKSNFFAKIKNWFSKEFVWKDSLEYDLRVEQEKFNSEMQKAKAKQKSDIEEFEEQ